jgi:transposase
VDSFCAVLKIIYFHFGWLPDRQKFVKKINNAFLRKTMPSISDDTYNNILSLLKQGNSIRKVANQCHVSKSKIQKIRAKHFPNLVASVGGRPTKLSAQNKRFCVREITSGRSKTGVEVSRKLKADLSINICDNTVRNALREAGLEP